MPAGHLTLEKPAMGKAKESGKVSLIKKITTIGVYGGLRLISPREAPNCLSHDLLLGSYKVLIDYEI